MLIFAKGLVKTNVYVYMTSRLNGMSHEQAIEWTLDSRFRDSSMHKMRIQELHSNLRSQNELEDFAWLVVCIYVYEQRDADPTKLKEKDLKKLMSMIEDLMKSYS